MKTVIEMAREAGLEEAFVDTIKGEVLVWEAEEKHLERLVAIARADEREEAQQANACAELRSLRNEVSDLKHALNIADAVFKERDRLEEANQAMLEALKDLREAVKYRGLISTVKALTKADAAIAKGEQA